MAFGDPAPGYTLPVVTPGEGFNAMMTRFYNEFGNVQGRNEKAFGYYEAEKAREADAYNRMLQEQELARKRQQMLDNERRQEEASQRNEAAKLERERKYDKAVAAGRTRAAGNAIAAQYQNLSSPIAYRFTDPKYAADVMISELPYRHMAMAQGKGSSSYGGPGADSSDQGRADDLFAATFREQTARSGYDRGRG